MSGSARNGCGKLKERQMEERIFSWSLDGFGSKLFRVTADDNTRFINRYSTMADGEDRAEQQGNEESEYRSFEEFWTDFTGQPCWLRYRPVFVHGDYKPFLLDFFSNINEGALTLGEQFRLILWLFKLEN